jgi:CRISPR/Cas system-associated endonuclease/helicase Cas3
MGKFDDQDDEIDDIEGEAEGEVEDDAEADTETEASASSSGSGSGGPAAAAEDSPDERTVASRQKLREEMAADVEAFLARGGKISQIEPNVTADPPRKPDSDYGSRPI